MNKIRLTLSALALAAPMLLFMALITIVSPPQIAYAATITVTNLNNSGTGSLRQAIVDASPGDTITFNITGTIILTSELSITQTLTIDGGNDITVSGNNSVRVFNIGANGVVTLANLAIVNGSSNSGGGIYNAGSLTLINNTVANNCRCLSSPDSPGGGGIYNNGLLTITNSTISDNSNSVSNTLGGGGILSFGPTTISNTIISGNYTVGFGGGISNRANLIMTNSTIVNNRATGGGGGIANAESTAILTILHSTIINNVSEHSFFPSGGINITSGSLTSIGHTVLANNSMGNCRGTLNSLDYNLIDNTANCTINGATGNNIIGQDPNLGALQDNGGPTLTNKPNSGSPLINAGAADCGTTVDQRGASRPYSTACDIGAFETHETIMVGSCGGTELNGTYPFEFTSGNTVTVTVTIPNGLKCIEIEEMGPAANHRIPTGLPTLGIDPSNWWHITGNITTGFTADIALPYVGADGDSRVCKWDKDFDWDCGPENGTGTSFTANSVMRTGINSFSDWAVGYKIAPMAITLSSTYASTHLTGQVGIFISFVLLIGLTLAVFVYRSKWYRPDF